ncbi:MAG: NAD-binding malic protein [Bdellovibrionales bacterium RIFCSPHIGHO2_01_FULL_40_29]|nr:MAG: NAD-binding malic protein [Bdellovibrionales bacterium RIFCSPHIGHO2_01_FULL_40_29]OFZ34206.1 MAG: NAD-binding malic protein [Bdellovibrionales bacterium RIFCSPHIGHO2_02_FULL_40_15]
MENTKPEKNFDKEALEFHKKGRPGKIEVVSTKDCNTEKALSLAYSPGVAAPCKEIAKNPDTVYDYTTKGNLVGVISDGTAVLGLGNIGPLAAKPVMEGKGILFKMFAGIDVFDIEVKSSSPAEFIAAVRTLEPTFGGINLEDIKAPECFEIEETLKREMNIPVFHDDQHGTAIVSGAALLNACQIIGKQLSDIRVVINGAGAASISCTNIFVSLGVQKHNVIMCDSNGVIFKGRTKGMNKYKEAFAVETPLRTLTEALAGADVFLGLSVAGAVTGEMLQLMNKDPIIFAMANPDPEIRPEEARKARPDAIIATGRSDYANQVNNVLGFPSIFRGALDTRSTQINEAMKLAACHALAKLAREEVPDYVSASYGGQKFKFGREYLIPKPFDTRVLLRVAPAVARAAIETKVARIEITDWNLYHDKLEAIQGPQKVFVRSAVHRVHENSKRQGFLPKIVFPEGTSSKILKALKTCQEEKICQPIILGYPDHILEKAKSHDVNLNGIEIINPATHPKLGLYAQKLFESRQRKGINIKEAERLMMEPSYFAAMMLDQGDADGMINGATTDYAKAVRPILQTIGITKNAVPAGLNIVLADNKLLFFTDTTVNFNPTAEQLAQIAIQTAQVAEHFGQKPRIAMLSFSNFSGAEGTPAKMKRAADIVRQLRPDILVEGDMQADTAVNQEIQDRIFPFSGLKGEANILVFPNLESANISYKLLQQLGKVEVLGPFLMGVRRAANVLQRTTTESTIFSSVVLTALEAQFITDYRSQKN